MSLNINRKDLPEHLREVPMDLVQKWFNIYKDINKGYGTDMAMLIANNWLSRTLDERGLSAPEQEDEDLINIIEDEAEEPKAEVTKLTFELQEDTEGKFIKRSRDGKEYVSFLLQDTEGDSDGVTYSPAVLKKWAEDINSGKILVGDLDHEQYDQILATSFHNPDGIKKKLSEKRGIAKAIEAVFEKGKLWVRAIIDKRYKRLLKKAGVSLEAYTEMNDDNKVVGGELLGFSFMTREPQANPRAVVS